MNNTGSVVIGFGNSTGRMSKTLLQQQYHLIERLNVKPLISLPKLRVKEIPQSDIGIFKTLISKRRNQMLLQSFIGLNDAENEENTLYKIRNEARTELQNINDELIMINALSKSDKNNEFIAETKATTVQAEEYLREFDGNVKKAVTVYKERQVIINRFAAKNKMDIATAKDILKANQYDEKLFD